MSASAKKKLRKEETLEEYKKKREEEIAREKIRAERRNAGLCQHCGGELKGFFSKKCVSYGKPKDY